MEILLYVLATLVAANLVVAILSLIRMGRPDSDKAEKALREEFRVSREESAKQSSQLREEVRNMQTQSNNLLIQNVNTMGSKQGERLDKLTDVIGKSGETTREQIETLIKRAEVSLKEIRASNEERFEKIRDSVNKQIQEMMAKEEKKLGEVVSSLDKLSRSNRDDLEKARKTLEENRKTLETQFQRIQESNEKKLDEMRNTVDEKLQSTLEKRLGESFRLVSERLEAVHKGLGEMQELATGVGDLKRVLSNVKTRGTFAEVQLGALLEQILTPNQYAKNVRPRPDSNEIVEYAIRLPGPNDGNKTQIWLPIDAKFPTADYERLQEAAESGDAKKVNHASNALIKTVESSAADIRTKYVSPPHTTDFAILFLPTEGLYAEVVRRPETLERLQHTHRVVPAGPTTLAAILNSLQMGFRTLAIEKRSSEVWKVLSAVKTEFSNFGTVLDKVKNQLDTASKSIDQTGRCSRAIERKLNTVEQLPAGEDAGALLGLPKTQSETSDE